MTDSNEEQKFGFVTIIGEPNAGKSTLINQITGAKVSIVSSKVQTTRTRVMGIIIHDKAQIVFVDTPGIFNANQKNNMEKAIVKNAWDSIADTDIIMVLVDASKKNGGNAKEILKSLQDYPNKKYILVLNKIDKTKRDSLLALSAELNEMLNFEATFMISATKADGIETLLKHVADTLPTEPWHYPEDQMTDMPMRLMAAEMTREKIFHFLHQELPYQITVETEKWEEFDNSDIKIDQTIFVSREAHKKIILGKGGAMIKKIGQASRKELEALLETKIHLKLFVKVHENWMSDKERFEIWGLDNSL